MICLEYRGGGPYYPDRLLFLYLSNTFTVLFYSFLEIDCKASQ